MNVCANAGEGGAGIGRGDGEEVIDTDEYMCEGWRESERAM